MLIRQNNLKDDPLWSCDENLKKHYLWWCSDNWTERYNKHHLEVWLHSCGGCRCTWTLFRLWGVQWQSDWDGLITRILKSHVNSSILHHCHTPIMTSSYTEPRPRVPLSRDLNAISSVKTKIFNLHLIPEKDDFWDAYRAEIKRKKHDFSPGAECLYCLA